MPDFFRNQKPVISLLALILACLLSTTTTATDAEGEPEELIVGTWDNRPIVFRDAAGEIKGLGVDILRRVAAEQGWKLVFKHGSWAEKYKELQNGDIDLLIAVAYTPERDKIFDYPEQTLINNWGVIYQTANNEISSIQDLQNKRVALVTKLIHSKVFTELMDKFNFPFTPVAAKDFEGVLQLLEEGKADAGVINRVVSIMRADQYHVKPTTIIFNPVQVRMAVPQGKHANVIKALDDYLIAAKTDNNSYYYQSVNKWLKTRRDEADYRWLIPLVSIILLVLLLAAGYIYLVRREVKRRTVQLAESENRFRQMADNINAVFWIFSADWNQLIYVSPGYEKIWGVPTTTLYADPRSWLDRVHPEDRRTVLADLDQKQPTVTFNPTFHEYRIIRPDLKECWISSRAYPVYNENNEVYRIVGISEDVTDRKQAEQDLSRSKSEFEAIFNSISDVVIYSDTNRRIVLTNPAMQEVFGYTNDEIVGQSTEILYADKEDFAEQGRRIFGVSARIDKDTFEINYKCKDGTVFIGETFGSKIFDSQGNAVAFIGVIRDVSERKKIQSELLRHRDHLEELVSNRTMELSTLNRELEAFSYSVSHDLRAPLRAINGFSSLLVEEYQAKLDDAAKDYLSRIIAASVKMERLIDDLLEISRVSRADLNKNSVDLSSMAEEILTTLQTEHPDRAVEWEVQQDLSTRGDPTLMHAMLQNLLDNAWKYTANREHAKIRFYRDSTNGSSSTYCIEDNGTGFDMRYKDKIFQPFQRLHSDKEFEGTGIGLATVNRVITRHSGEIWATSTPGQGSHFYFRLQTSNK
jgi:PAS domain S-box-containing protein